MNPGSFQNILIQKLKNEYSVALKGTQIDLHLPVHELLINDLLRLLISESTALNDFQSIVVSDLTQNEFDVAVSHKRLQKIIRCRLQSIHYNSHSEPLLTIVFVTGLNVIEKLAMDTATVFKSSWDWFKSKLSYEEIKSPKASPALKISSSSLTVNLAELLRQQKLDYLNQLILWKEFSTGDNKLIIDIIIKI